MSGQTARWRSLYSSSRSGRTRSRKQTRSTSADLRVAEAEHRRDVADLRGDVPDAERDVVRGALVAPALEERARRDPEAQPAVRVADAEGRAGDGLALGDDELQAAVGRLRAADD